MAEETQATEDAQTGAAAQSGERTFTQDEVNKLVGEARTKVRKQYEGYVDGSQLSEATERAAKAEQELAQLRADAQRRADVAAAAEKAGIPLEVAQSLHWVTNVTLVQRVIICGNAAAVDSLNAC